MAETADSVKDIKTEFNVVSMGPSLCQIIPGRIRTNQIAPQSAITEKLDQKDAARNLVTSGFNREGGDYTRRDCLHCSSCLPSRLVLKDFQPNRTLRRVLRDNADLHVESVKTYNKGEHLDLFTYHRLVRKLSRNLLNEKELDAMIQNPYADWGILEARLQGELVGVCLFDAFDDRLHGNQFYYDTNLSDKRSLGKFMILKCIEHAIGLGKDYLYMGALTLEPSKLHYKAAFKPMEVRRRHEWQALELLPEV